MTYEQIWALLALIAGLGLVAARIVARQLARRAELKRREWVHAERMAALERGVPFHDLPPDLVEEVERPDGDPAAEARWVQRSALGLGLVLALGGMGVVVGFGLVPETSQTLGMQQLAPLGLIPLLAGVGLLLFAYLLWRSGSKSW